MDARWKLRGHSAAPIECPGIRDEIDRIKRDLGERGKPWWTDGAPYYNRHLAKNTPYAEWFADLAKSESDAPRS